MAEVHKAVRLHATNLIGDSCYAALSSTSPLVPRGPCLRLLLSKLLGSLVVLGGSVFKLPQMYKILKARSARGISLATYVLECFVYATNLAYSWRRELPLSTYGEQMSLTVQNMFITLLILRYGRGASQRPSHFTSGPSSLRRCAPRLLLALLLMGSGTFALFSPRIVPPPLLGWLQALTVPADLASKVPQMRRLYQDKATGQLSALLVFLQLAGTLTRCFTTVTETGDHQMLLGYALAALFNAIIAAQYVYYWHGEHRQGYRSLSSSSSGGEEGEAGPLSLRLPEMLPRQVRRKERGRSMDERRQGQTLAPPRRSHQFSRRPSPPYDARDVGLGMPTDAETAAFELGMELGRVERLGIKRD